MPQVDLETLVSVCTGAGDRKITCETLADHDGGEKLQEEEKPDLPPDFPPESFWLSKDAEYDWFDRNAFFERKDSTKGNSNSTNPNPHPASNSSSQRFSSNLKSKAAMIGLPKTQKTSYVDTTNRRNCKPANIRLFPKKPKSVGPTTVAVAEPSSPKVSCMGRVRSKRGQKKSSEQATAASKPAEKTRSVDRRRTGFCGIFRSRRKERPGGETYAPPRRSVTVKAREFPAGVGPEAEAEAEAVPPGLGGMMRFASGRRSSSVADDLT